VTVTIFNMSEQNSRRKKSAPVPKEHGAWFMLGHCVLIGALVAGSFQIPVALVGLSSFLVFVAMQGLKQLARAFRRREHQIAVRIPWISLVFLLAAVLLGLWAVVGWDRVVLLYWGAIGGVLTGIYVAVLFQRKERSLLGEWLGILGLTSTAGVIWSAGTSEWGGVGFLLWGLAFLYFGGTVPFVRLRVRQMKEGAIPWRSKEVSNALLYNLMALLFAALGVWLQRVPPLALAPFGLSLAKTIWAVSRDKVPQKIAHVGYSEAVMSTIFAVLMIVAFWPFS
jgi:hypothetical protein